LILLTLKELVAGCVALGTVDQLQHPALQVGEQLVTV
jgi:hypothetical protein